MLATYGADADIRKAFDVGAPGYLLKDATRDELFRAVRAAGILDVRLEDEASRFRCCRPRREPRLLSFKELQAVGFTCAPLPGLWLAFNHANELAKTWSRLNTGSRSEFQTGSLPRCSRFARPLNSARCSPAVEGRGSLTKSPSRCFRISSLAATWPGTGDPQGTGNGWIQPWKMIEDRACRPNRSSVDR